VSSWVGVWLLAKANPLQEHHVRTAASSLGIHSTRKTLTDRSKSCKGQKDCWVLQHIRDKERLRKLCFSEKSLRVKHCSKDPGLSVGSQTMDIFNISQDRAIST